MITVSARLLVFLVGGLLFLSVWSIAYFLWPRFSFDDGPFFAETFTGDLNSLSRVSSLDLTLLGTTLFVLETLATNEPNPRTVLLLKNRGGGVRWAKVTSSEFGRIELVDRPPRWSIPGGWIVAIKPERTEGGELYLSAFGSFRFFFHSW